MKPLVVQSVMMAIVLVALLGPPAVAAGASTQSVQGVVVDGTAGAKLPTGLVARLSASNANPAAPPDQTASVGADGRFAFADVPTAAASDLRVDVDYAGATYGATVPAADGNGISALKISVFEPTTAEDVLKIDTSNWIVESIDDVNQQVVVLETVNLVNASDRTYVGDHRGDPGSDSPGVLPRTLRIYIPQGASGFQVVSGLDPTSLLPVAGGFVDTTPVLPGPHQYAYSYRIVFADGGMEIKKSLPYPTQKLRVLIPNAGLQLQSDKLANSGTVDVQGRSYVVLSADSVPPNSDVTLDALGFPASPELRLVQTMQTIGLSLAGIAVVAAVALGLRPKKSAQDVEVDRRREILLAIARLDAQRADGKIDPQKYDDERARQKSRLVAIATGGDRNDAAEGA